MTRRPLRRYTARAIFALHHLFVLPSLNKSTLTPPAPPSPLAATRQRRWGNRIVPPTPRRRGALLPSPTGRPLSHHRLRNRGTRPHGLLPPRRAQHLSTRSGAGLACPLQI